MAARTFTATTDNLWSNAANWGGSVPVSGDTATIPAGELCEFDVDQTAFATGLAGLAIAGELKASTTPGAYVLKMAGDVTGVGVLRAGTAETAYPLTCTFTILLNGNYSIKLTGAGSIQLYCTEPTTRMIALSAAEDIGQTELSVDTDVTGDIWKVGDLVRVDDVGGDADSQQHTIAGIAASTITVTAGLSAAKKIGAKVILVSRNVKIVGNGAGTTSKGIEAPADGVSRCELRGCTSGVIYGSGHTVSGTVSGCTYGVYFGSGHTVSGTVSGCTYGVYSGSGHTVSGTVSGCTYGVYSGSGHTVSGTVSGCTSGVREGSGHTVSGVVSGCTNGVREGSGHTISGTVGINTSADIYQVTEFRAFGARFLSTVEFSGYSSSARLAYHYAESIDHDGIAGAYRAWCRGGIVNSVASPVPTGHDIAYQHVCGSSSYPVFRRWTLQVQPGARLRVVGKLRKDRAMTYRPRLQIIGQDADTLFDPANEPLAEQAMTDSVDTWEQLTLEWTNTASTPRDVWIRTIAMAATGNVYSAVDWDAIDVDGVLADIETILSNVSVPTSELATATNLAALAGDVGTIGNDVTDIRSNVDAKITSRASASEYTAARAAALDNLDAAISTRAATADLANVANDIDNIGTDVTNILNKTDVATSSRASATDLAAVAGNVDAILADTGTDGVLVSTTGLAAIAAAVWDRLTSALTTVGSVGAYFLSKLALLTGATTVTVVSPMSGDTITTVIGDDYDSADGRGIEWDISTVALSIGDTVSVVIGGVGAFDASIVDADTIRLELTHAQTATITEGAHPYQVILTQADTDVLTLVEGLWISRARLSAA